MKPVTDWQPFCAGLPNVQVTDLEINYCAGKLRAGTWGRGLWESDLAEQPTLAREITTNNRHVVAAYAAIWLLAVGFVLIMWRRQQAMKLEIARLEDQLRKVEEEDAKRKAAKAKAAAPKDDGGAS